MPQQQELQAVGEGAEGALPLEQLCLQWHLVEAGMGGTSSYLIHIWVSHAARYLTLPG